MNKQLNNTHLDSSSNSSSTSVNNDCVTSSSLQLPNRGSTSCSLSNSAASISVADNLWQYTVQAAYSYTYVSLSAHISSRFNSDIFLQYGDMYTSVLNSCFTHCWFWRPCSPASNSVADSLQHHDSTLCKLQIVVHTNISSSLLQLTSLAGWFWRLRSPTAASLRN